MKSTLYFVLLFLITNYSFSQFGKNGSLTLTTGTTVVNQYSSISNNISIGQNTIAVSSISNLNTSSTLTCGDLILIYQAQGANMASSNSTNYGLITNHNSAGLFELKQVDSVNGNIITLTSSVTNSYSTTGKTQIVKVPQYSDLTLNSSSVISSNIWNGSTGGIIIIHAKDSIILNGKIYNTGKGFRGGIARTSGYTYFGTQYISSTITEGGEKGEGVCGYYNEYDSQGGRYCRGAAGNAGGGGTNHNAGGGGGANASNGNAYSGAGIMCTTCPGVNAWLFDADYISNANNYTNSSGGGKGGNSYSGSPQNPLTTSPGNSSWGSDNWRNIGGRGGRPLSNINYLNRVYFGGGGGAGDANDNSGGSGANGGGVVFLISPKITGSGFIIANGDSAANSINIHADALGGGGGGGSIIINTSILSNNINMEAKGGKGGSMIKSNGTGYVIGTGGGGGGGYICYPNTSLASVNVIGGSTGKNYFPTISAFPENGGTNGGSGLIQPVSNYTLVSDVNLSGSGIIGISVSTNSICLGANAIITPSGASNYSLSIGVTSNTNFTVNPTSTTTYTIYGLNSCNNSFTTVTIIVNQPTVFSTSNQTICSGQTATLFATGATNYTWSPNNTVANSVIVAPISTIIYSVTGSNATNCTNTQTLLVSVIPTPSLSTNNSTICAGSSTSLTVSGATSYTWNLPNNSASVNTTSIIVSPSVTTNYTITGSNSNCQSSAIVTVAVLNPTSTINVNLQNVCSGITTTLIANGASNYTWLPGNILGSSISVNFASPTIYTVIGTSNNCSVISTFTIGVTQAPILTVNSKTICEGQITVLTANSSVTNYIWLPNGQNTSSITASPNATTIYSVMSVSNTCSSIAIATVVVNTLPSLVTNNNIEVCLGQTTQLNVSGANTYTWLPGNYIGNTFSISPISSSQYTILGESIKGCVNSSIIFVNITNSLSVNVNSPIICKGESVLLVGNSNGNQYHWEPSMLAQTPNNSSTFVNPISTTVFTFETSYNGNCVTTATTNLIVNNKPIVFAGNDTIINMGESFVLLGNSSYYSGWKTLDGSTLDCNYCVNAIVSPKKNACYILESQTSQGCISIDTICITINKEWSIYIPNAFTPNGDLKNDLFFPYGYGIENYELYIFDRWGEQIFKSDIDHNGWNGFYKNQTCEMGVYTYMIIISTYSKQKEKKIGHVTLLK
jgi:gliding motility-associated-like protein